MNHPEVDTKTEVERLRDENTVLRSLLTAKFTCPDCSKGGNVQNEIQAIRSDISEMKIKQHVDSERNRKMIEKIRVVLVKSGQEKRAKSARSTMSLEDIIENQQRDDIPTSSTPKPISMEEKFAGKWRLISSDDAARYTKFRGLLRDEYVTNVEFKWNGNCLILPPEPEVVKQPKLHSHTQMEGDHLQTILKSDEDHNEEVLIDRFLEGDNKMTIVSCFKLFYNLTNSRQFISCTRVYERVM